MVVGTYGAICLGVFAWALSGSGRLAPGEDAIEPMALLAAPVAVKVLYTLGWLTEVALRKARPTLAMRPGPALLKLGLGVGLLLVTLPAAFWVGVRVMQVAGVLK